MTSMFDNNFDAVNKKLLILQRQLNDQGED